MIVPGTLAPLRPVFISFSSKDLKLATTICQAIESRGAACWISNRDVKGGENFQEAIISAIHDAKIMVLVFSANTNNSGEIKKELALASQNGLVVIPVRVEDVLPSGAFAYELSTRQWVDLFHDWENAMEGLTGRIASVLGTADVPPMREAPEPPKKDDVKKHSLKTVQKDEPRPRRMPLIAGALAVCIALAGGGAYYYQRNCCTPPQVPPAPVDHQVKNEPADFVPLRASDYPGTTSGKTLPVDKKPSDTPGNTIQKESGPSKANPSPSITETATTKASEIQDGKQFMPVEKKPVVEVAAQDPEPPQTDPAASASPTPSNNSSSAANSNPKPAVEDQKPAIDSAIASRDPGPSQKDGDPGKSTPTSVVNPDPSAQANKPAQPDPKDPANAKPAASDSSATQTVDPHPDTQDKKAVADTVVASREPSDTDPGKSQDDRTAPKRAPQAASIPIGAPPKLADAGDGGQVFRECTNCPAMVVIPAGTNWVGSAANQSGHDSSEEPRREVRFKQPFAIGRDAVTYAEWDECVAEGGCNHFLPGDMGWGRGQQPVVLVSWEDAKAYTDWLSQKTGAKYRLPFEAEWEYAARACRLAICQDQIFWFGNKISPDRANYDWRYAYAGSQKAQALGKPKPTGTDGPNAFGLFNAVGNVSQWVEDCWNDNLKTLPGDGSARLSGDCASRVFRGGSWHDEPVDLRSASRKPDLSNSRQPFIGFRVARVLAE